MKMKKGRRNRMSQEEKISRREIEGQISMNSLNCQKNEDYAVTREKEREKHWEVREWESTENEERQRW